MRQKVKVEIYKDGQILMQSGFLMNNFTCSILISSFIYINVRVQPIKYFFFVSAISTLAFIIF